MKWLPPDNWAERKMRGLLTEPSDPTKPFVFLISCVAAEGEDIDLMKESAEEIEYSVIAEMCDLQTFARLFGYENKEEDGLILQKDWHVTYHRSTYQGHRCYYL